MAGYNYDYFYYGGPGNLPPVILKPDEVNPQEDDSLYDEKKGNKESFDLESATFMDKQDLIGHKRTDYSNKNVGCGTNFHPSLDNDGNPIKAGGSRCEPGSKAEVPVNTSTTEANDSVVYEARDTKH